jgi:hypothetical protein
MWSMDADPFSASHQARRADPGSISGMRSVIVLLLWRLPALLLPFAVRTMNLFQQLLLAPAALGLMAPLALDANRPASAADLNLAGLNQYGSSADQVTSITQFSDVQPTDRITDVTDELKRLMNEFEKELAVLKGRVDGLEAKVAELEATQFSTTTKLSGLATFVLGANAFSGSSSRLVDAVKRTFGATTFNYDVQLNFDTSFTGQDLLRTTLRSGNFDFFANSFGGAGPSGLSQLEVAFQEDAGRNVVGIDRLFYQFPWGDFTFTLGGRVGQEDMLAIWPSVYPAETVLDVLTLGGAPGAYNKNLGAGAGVWWQKNGFAISANYVAANGSNGNPNNGGIATDGAGGTGSVQIGYAAEQWGLVATYSYIQNANDLFVYATNFTLDSFQNPGNTSAFGLSAYWQPAESGWIPSISAGWGINSTSYNSTVNDQGLVSTSQSWSVGLQWEDAFMKGNALGMGVGQAPFATSLKGDESPNDSNYVWEWWYKVQVTDNIAVTPALFYLSRPLGGDTPDGKSFNQLGGLIKTSFSF